MAHSNATERGFTLLEVLVALVLFSFILVMLYASLYSTGHNWRLSEIRVRENDDRRLTLSLVRRLIGQAAPIVQLGSRESRVLFLGEDRSLRFVSRLPAHHAGSGLFFLQLAVRQDELTLEYLPLTGGRQLFAKDFFRAAETVNLSAPVEAIDLDYFGRDDPAAEPSWRDTWDNPARLPELVRFQVLTDEPESWPALLIALRTRTVAGQPQLSLHVEEDASEE